MTDRGWGERRVRYRTTFEILFFSMALDGVSIKGVEREDRRSADHIFSEEQMTFN